MTRIPVLAYHALTKTRGGEGANRYNIPLAEFTEQMRWLSGEGYRTPSLEEITEQGREPEGRRVAVTFDDGDISNYRLARPVLEKHGLRAIYFVPTAAVERNPRCMNWQQLRELVRDGHSVQSHGHTHSFLNRLDRRGIHFELEESRRLIYLFTRVNPVCISCPGGRYDRRLGPIARSLGYKRIFTSRPGYLAAGLPGSYLAGRHTIVTGMDLEDFRGIVEMRASALLRRRMAYAVKGTVKRVVGDSLYQDLFRYINNR